jgi:predicted RNA-binding protein with PIN domain
METVIVERELPRSYSHDEVRSMEDLTAWCFEAYRVTRLKSYLSSDGQKIVCVLEAPDVESVRQANAKAGLPVTRIYRATVHPTE